MKKVGVGLIVLFFAITTVQGRSRHSVTSQFKSYHGLVMAGYQGWFNAPGDGAGRGWNHYYHHGELKPGSINVDLWPDVREYAKVYQTPFVYSNGKPACLFSSYDQSTVDLHFKWMHDYGIDGVFVQRFVSNLKSRVSIDANNHVLKNAIHASEKYKRAIALMYDLSGMNDKDDSLVINDWKHLIDSLHLTDRGPHQTYLYHRNKPLVALWGVGFADNRAYSLASVQRIIKFLKSDPVYGGCAILLGVPTYWRDQNIDTIRDPRFFGVIKMADIVQPWFVGRVNAGNYSLFLCRMEVDREWCQRYDLDYVPVIFPGFSWHNMNPGSPQNQISRYSGSFYWAQLSGAISKGMDMLYIAMFDELDEGTAIFKISKNPPVGASSFVKFEENIPEDYYLYLTGYASRMLKGKIPFTNKIPPPPAGRK